LVCFVQVAEEPGFSKIVGIKIGGSQTDWVVRRTSFMLKTNFIHISIINIVVILAWVTHNYTV
jgi:hypothetical protein